MAWVCSPAWQVNVCMDRDLRREANGRFMGSVGRLQCQAWCQARGRRLPTNNEWMVACEGTQPAHCLRPAISHPIMHRLRSPRPWIYNEVDCKVGTNAWRSCMSDLRLNDRARDPQSGATIGLPTAAETRACVSRWGVRNMVGVLGQWVVDTYPSPAGGGTRGQFNGGLYPQPASSCNYTTVAHPADYTDYSIGCRCSRTVDAGGGDVPPAHAQPRSRPRTPPPARPARSAAGRATP
jgi:formylglycine-generating enzyme required for sulfatase activity